MLREQSQFITNLHRLHDMLLVIAAFICSYYIKKYYLPSPLVGLSTVPNYYLVLLTAVFISFLVFNAFSLYESKRTTRIKTVIIENLKVVIVSHFLIIFFLYLLHVPPISRIFFVLNGSLLFIFLTTSKIAVYKSLKYHRSKNYNTRNIIIVGTEDMAKELIKAVIKNPNTGYKILGCLETQENNVQFGKPVYRDIQVIGSIAHYNTLFYDNAIDELVFAVHPFSEIENIGEIISFAEKLGINTRIMPDFQLHRIMFKPETARVEIKQFIGLPTISISSTPADEAGMIIKAFIDYLGAIVGLILTAPLFLIIALLIKVTSPGPIFFLQERCGLYGRRFNVIKFRTMVQNAGELKEDLLGKNEMNGPVFKIKTDPRVTQLGSILRKTSLDELPQLVNILLGQMSFIGPRPPIPEEVEQYKPWQRRRLSMKPGLSCLWQVNGRNEVDFEDWMRLDLQYIDNWSAFLDTKIFLLTVWEIFSLNGR